MSVAKIQKNSVSDSLSLQNLKSSRFAGSPGGKDEADYFDKLIGSATDQKPFSSVSSVSDKKIAKKPEDEKSIKPENKSENRSEKKPEKKVETSHHDASTQTQTDIAKHASKSDDSTHSSSDDSQDSSSSNTSSDSSSNSNNTPTNSSVDDAGSSTSVSSDAASMTAALVNGQLLPVFSKISASATQDLSQGSVADLTKSGDGKSKTLLDNLLNPTLTANGNGQGQEGMTDANSKSALKNSDFSAALAASEETGSRKELSGLSKSPSATSVAADRLSNTTKNLSDLTDLKSLAPDTTNVANNLDHSNLAKEFSQMPVVDPLAGKPILKSGIQNVGAVSRPLSTPAMLEDIRSIRNQVQESLGPVLQEGKNELNLQLQPPEWGKVNIQVRMEDNGIHLNFLTQHTFVKDALDHGMADLKSSFLADGLQLGNVHVGVGGEFSSQGRGQGREAGEEFQSSRSELIRPLVAGAGTASFQRSGSSLLDTTV